MNSKLLWLCLTLILSSKTHAAVETYLIDSAHSSVSFRVRHFFTNVPGRFDRFEGTLTIDRSALEKSSVSATIEVDSINTSHPGRDKHLLSPDFFDVQKFPKMTYQSKEAKKISDNEFEVTGDLTMRGITKSVVMKIKCLGFGKGMKDVNICGAEAIAVIKRSDFGITSGAPAVGDDVQIEINIEAKQ